MNIDMHVHTIYSYDSIIKIDELISICKSKNIVPAITDHNSIKAITELKKKNFKFIPGEEILTDKGDLIGLFIQEEIKKGTEFFEVIDLIKAQGGITYLPHPFDIFRKGVHCKKCLISVDVIEVINAKSNFIFDYMANVNAKRLNKLRGAGSDAHVPYDIGNAYVKVEGDDELEPKIFLKMLKNSKIIIKRRTSILSKLLSMEEKLRNKTSSFS